jgi:hypothetical protein
MYGNIQMVKYLANNFGNALEAIGAPTGRTGNPYIGYSWVSVDWDDYVQRNKKH